MVLRLFLKVSTQDSPRKSISTLISLLAKREVIWFIYNPVPPPLYWKPWMTWCLPSAEMRVFCQMPWWIMCLVTFSDFLWGRERAGWKGGEEAGKDPCLPRLPSQQQEEGAWRNSWMRLSPPAPLPLASHQYPSFQRSPSQAWKWEHYPPQWSSTGGVLFRERREISVLRSCRFQDCCSLIKGKTDPILARLLWYLLWHRHDKLEYI